MHTHLALVRRTIPSVLPSCRSDLRPLRLSATIAAYYLMRGLIKSVNKLHKGRNTSLQAGQKELKKTKKTRNQDLIDQHEDEVRDADEKINVIHKLLGTTFNRSVQQ